MANIREDGYGGDIAGRSRFAIDIITEIRKRLGSSFPISFKISAQEFVPDGLTVEESIDILKLLVTAGIDAVQVHNAEDPEPGVAFALTGLPASAQIEGVLEEHLSRAWAGGGRVSPGPHNLPPGRAAHD